jgi:cystathionine beta-lyase
MKNDFDRRLDRRGTNCAKWDLYPEDVLPMWVADMDFRSPEPVVQALRERIDQGVFGYGTEPCDLREIIVARLEQCFHWKVAPEALVFLPGVVTGFNLACHTFTAPGDGLLIQTPVYPPILHAHLNSGLRSESVELTRYADGSYELDLHAFEEAITDTTRMFLLCNPHNPVGRVFRQAELENMAEICLRHDLLICSDEIHGDLIYSPNRHVPIASLSTEIAERAITFMAPSKTFNIAGLESSFAIIPNAELRKQFCHGRLGITPEVNVLGMVATRAAYLEGQEWLDEAMAYLTANRAALLGFLQTEMPSISCRAPEGTYLAWLDCRAAGIAGNPSKFFLEKAKVALNAGEDFGKGGEGFVRLNFGCPREMLMEALEKMKAALA